MYYQAGFVLLLFVAFVYYLIYTKPKKMLHLYAKQFQSRGYRVLVIPFNPFAIPIFQLQQAQSDKYKTTLITATAVFNKYDVIISNVLTAPWIVIASPHLLKQFICKEGQFLYEKHKMFTQPVYRILGNGVLLSNGARWTKKRKILNKVFKFDDIKNLHETIAKKADQALRFIEKGQEQSEIKKVSFQDYAFYLTEKTILECFLGSEDSQKAMIEGKTVAQYNVELVDQYVTSLVADPFALILGQKFENLGLRAKDRYFTRKMKALNDWISEYIKKRLIQERLKIKEEGENYKGEDIFSAILKQNYLLQKSGEEGLIYSVQQLSEEFKTFIFTGTDTSASALKVMIYLVFKHKQAEEKLREEISRVFKNTNDFSYQNLKQCTYLEAVFKETLRLYGPVNFNIMRRAVKSHMLDGVRIRQGTVFEQFTGSFHYSERYYRNATYFKPERWLNGECQEMNLFNFVPFNSGNRSCIGKNLATMQIKIGLIMVLLRYKKVEILDEALEFNFKSVLSCQDYKALATT